MASTQVFKEVEEEKLIAVCYDTVSSHSVFGVTCSAATSIKVMHVDLPPFILLHALGLVAVGMKLLFLDRPEKSGLGIATTAIGACYLVTAYVPQEQNVFLHASGLVRMGLAALAGLKLVLSPSLRRSSERNALLGIMLYDGLGGLHLCYYLSNFSGLAPGA